MIRLPNTPEPKTDAKGQVQEDPRHLSMWRNEIYRMFNLVGATTDTPGLIAAGAIGTLTVTVTGCLADKNQTVHVGAPAAVPAGLTWSGYVSANDTVTIRLHNVTASPITPASLTWTVRVFP